MEVSGPPEQHKRYINCLHPFLACLYIRACYPSLDYTKANLDRPALLQCWAETAETLGYHLGSMDFPHVVRTIIASRYSGEAVWRLISAPIEPPIHDAARGPDDHTASSRSTTEARARIQQLHEKVFLPSVRVAMAGHMHIVLARCHRYLARLRSAVNNERHGHLVQSIREARLAEGKFRGTEHSYLGMYCLATMLANAAQHGLKSQRSGQLKDAHAIAQTLYERNQGNAAADELAQTAARQLAGSDYAEQWRLISTSAGFA